MKTIHDIRYEIIKIELEIEDLLESRKQVNVNIEEIDQKIKELKERLSQKRGKK